jgi:hypothetical protein
MDKKYHSIYMQKKKKELIKLGRCVDCWVKPINKRRSKRRCTRCLLRQKKTQLRYRIGLQIKNK